jgi:orotidine-5'-phosphate decarboxylase
MNITSLYTQIIQRQSYLCVGLDTDPTLIPDYLQNQPDGVLTFNKAIIEATQDLCVSYKINTAFYEAQGLKGWEIMEKTLSFIPKDKLVIADAKRGDIGNTAKKYAQSFFETMSFDALTVAPYMGEDSVKPFLEYPDKWVILLALTSNMGSQDFQMLRLKNGNLLYEEVLKKSSQWGNASQMMFVVGATQAALLPRIRNIVPDYFLLVPGVGAQGGSLEEVSKYGMNSQVGLLVNASRSILYASSGEDFPEAAHKEAFTIQQEMKVCLEKYLKD